MINQEKIKEWVREYLKHIQEITLDVHVTRDEGYKFLSINNFQKHFNIEELDLSGMLDRAILNNNLVVGAMYFPKKMLLIYAQDYTEETRLALRDLFDESKDVYVRMTEAKEAFDNISKIRNIRLEETSNSYIGLRFLSLLLGYRFPEKYNALKPAEWKFFAKFLDSDFSIPNRTPVGEQYRIYNLCIEALRNHLKDRKEMEPIREALTQGLPFNDAELHWVTQGVIYVTAKLLAGEKSEQKAEPIVSSPENEEEVSTTSGVLVEDYNTGFMPLEKHLEEYIMKNWDIIDFGEELTVYRDEDGTPAQQYVTDVGIVDILAKDTKGNFVVLELKRAESKYAVVGQILNYMSWVEENLASDKEKVRGIIIVGKADNTLKYALRQVQDKVILKEYRIKMTFSNPE